MHCVSDGLSMLLYCVDPLDCSDFASCFTESLGIQQKRHTIRNTHLHQGMYFDMYLHMIEGQFSNIETMKHSRTCILSNSWSIHCCSCLHGYLTTNFTVGHRGSHREYMIIPEAKAFLSNVIRFHAQIQ